MLKIFGGMVIGSIMTIMLLGGVSAADQVLTSVQSLYFEQIDRPDTTTTLILLITLSILLSVLSLWPQKPAIEPESIIKNLKRHCQ